MATPGIITGGNVFRATGTNPGIPIFKDTSADTEPESELGVFGKYPGSTPKYALNRGTRDAENRESMARLFVEMPSSKISDFLKSVSPQTRPLAQVLATGTGTGGSGGTGFIDFLLTQANENFQEKAQIVDTLTDNYVAFYSGQEPPAFQYGGVLLNTYQDDQRVWMLRLYREILRGTRLANRNLIARLRYDSFIVSGYLETLNLSLSGETDNTASQFSFTMRIKRMQVLTPQLGAPTIVQSAATTDVVLKNGNETLAQNERVGGVTQDTPPTATRGPATDTSVASAALVEEKTREFLRALGKSDDDITAVLKKAGGEELNAAAADEDLRNQIANQETQSQDRVALAIRGTDPEKTNIQNNSNDALNGATNVYAQERVVTPAVSSPAVEVPFVQSGLSPSAASTTAPVADTTPGYQSQQITLKQRAVLRTRGRVVATSAGSGV